MSRDENTQRNSTPRIGFVVDWLNDSYQLEVLRGAARAARDEGAELVIFPGGVLGAQHEHGARRNALYRMLSPSHYDGLVLMTGTLGNAGGKDIMRDVAPDFPKARVCHVAVPVEGCPSVLIDNQTGMRRIIEHLVRVHRRRHIAFIQGPLSNPEAAARFQTYRDVLEVHDLRFDERLVAPGDFLWDAGTDAVRVFFDERGLSTDDIDAIVAADDLMALAAMEELRRRGIRVPSQIAVVGFDDVEESRFAFPPLSTVHQPLFQQGKVAVKKVLSALRGGEEVQQSTLATVCRFRRSCGCTAEDPGALTARPKSDTRMSLKDSVVRRSRVIAAELAGELGSTLGELGDSWQEELIAGFLQTLEGREEAFREAFDSVLERILDLGVDASVGHVVTSALRRQLSVCAGDDPGQIRRVEGLLHEARILTSNAVGRSEAQRRLRLEREAAGLAKASVLFTSLRGQPVDDRLGKALGYLGIDNCVIFASANAEDAQLLYLLNDGVMVPLVSERSVQLQATTPEAFLDPALGNFLIEPLDDGIKMVGVAFLPFEQVRPYLVETIRELLSDFVLHFDLSE